MTTAMKEQQFSDFVTKYKIRLERYLTAKVGLHAAQDILQEALLSVWQKWDTIQAGDRIGYVYGACRNGAYKEYEARKRAVLVAEMSEDLLGDDYGPAEDDLNAHAILMSLYERKAISEPTLLVATEIAAGYDKHQIAERMDTSVAEVNRSVRELRRGWTSAALQAKAQASVPTYTPRHSSVLTAVTTVLTRGERQVIALSALGLKPITIAPLLGISQGSARTTLSHARTKLVAEFATPGIVTTDVDASIRKAMTDLELLALLPKASWRTEALRLAELHIIAKQTSTSKVAMKLLISTSSHLRIIAAVLIEVRKALEDRFAIASQVGSFSFRPPGTRYFPIPIFHEESAYKCPPPSWSPVRPRRPVAVSPFLFKVIGDDDDFGMLGQHKSILLRWVSDLSDRLLRYGSTF